MASGKPKKRESSREDQPMVRVLRQREMVEHMKHDNEVLRLDLTREARDARRSNSTGAAADIQRLQDEAGRYVKRIEAERRKIEELDLAIAKYQEKILDQKARVGGVNAAQENNKLIQQQVRVLENRLDKNLTRFNETLAQNKSLRSRIDEYRRERVVFDGIYKKLERELHEKKREMAAIIDDSKNAFQKRDKSQSELAALQANADKEREAFEREFKDMGEMIKQQQAALEALRLKQFERTNTASGKSDETKQLMGGSTSDGPGNWSGNKGASNAPLSQEIIHSYEDAIKRIQETTGCYDINEIVTRFLEAEEQNFSLFNYVNDINSEIERLEHNISDMRNQIEKYRGQGMSSDTQRKKTVRDLEEKFSKTEKKSEDYIQRYEASVRTTTQLKNGIHSIFQRIGASNTSVDEMLGNQGVTESNMLQYLGIIEQRTSEILQQFAASQIGASNEYSLQLPSIVAAEKTAQLTVQPPSGDDVGSDDDEAGGEDERPLTRQEILKRTAKDFQRKTQTM